MNYKTKKTIENTLSALLFIAVSIYIIFQFVRNNLNKYETDISTYAVFNSSVKAQVTLFCDETLLTKKSSGGVRYLVSNGDRVSKNGVICNVYSKNINVADFVKLNAMKSKLDMYKKSNLASSSQSDISTIDGFVKKSYTSFLKSIKSDNYKESLSLANDTLVMMNRRLIASGKSAGFNSEITDLTLSIDKLEGGSAVPSETVQVNTSGYFFKKADGYENIFKPSKLESITIESFRELIKSSPEKVGDDVIGKLCTSYAWYFACEVDTSVAADMTVGNSYSVEFQLNGDIPVNATLYKKIEQPKYDTAVLVFTSVNFPDDFNYRRTQPVKLRSDSFEGVRVPSDAVRILNGETGVYVIIGNKIEFRRIDIIYTSGIYCISKAEKSENQSDNYNYRLIGPNETVIISGKDIYEGKIIE